MSEAYDLLLTQRHEAALEAKIEAQAETIARLVDAIKKAIKYGMRDNAEQVLLDALEEV